YGNSASPSYTALTSSGGCSVRDSAAPSYPQQNYLKPIYLACSYTASDGLGGTYQVHNDFYNSDADLQGRGWLGFERMYSQDTRTNVVHMVSYSTQFPNLGIPNS